MTTKDVTVDGNLTSMTAPALADRLLIVDDGTTSLQDITPDNLLKVINLLTADSAPARTADYVATWDNSATGAKKVLLSLLGAYTIQFSALTFDPADNTTYFFGSYISTPTTTNLRRRIHIPRAGVITACYIDVVITGTLGTAENTTFSIRVNDTTDTTVSSVAQLTAANNLYTKTDLALSVAAGDSIEMKIVTPAGGYATNPTGVQITGTILVA